MRRIGVKVAAFGPPVVFSVLLTIVLLAAVPPTVALVVFLGIWVVAVALMIGVGEGTAGRVLFGCRRIHIDEAEDLAVVIATVCRVGLGPPVVTLRVRDRADVAADGLGRRTVVLSSGLVEAVRTGCLPPDQAGAVILHAAARVRAGWHRSDLAVAWLALPWRVLAEVWLAVASMGRQFPATTLVWQARIVVFAIAVVQAFDAGAYEFAALFVVIAAVSYGLPYAQRDWDAQVEAAGDRAVLELGMAASLAAFLRRHAPHTPRTRERLRRLDPPVAASQAVLGVVVSR